MKKNIDRKASKKALLDAGYTLTGFAKANGFALDTFKKYFYEPSPMLPGSNTTVEIEAALKKKGVARYSDNVRNTVHINKRKHSICVQQGNVKGCAVV